MISRSWPLEGLEVDGGGQAALGAGGGGEGGVVGLGHGVDDGEAEPVTAAVVVAVG
jgi:hypothetical protein